MGFLHISQILQPQLHSIKTASDSINIDFGLKIIAKLRSPAYAQAVQLYLEYDPQPPFNAGSPEKAPPAVRRFLKDMFVGMRENALATAKRAMQRIERAS